MSLHGTESQVVMFMSVDVVGSTAFKASAQRDGADWLQAFETLFRELPLIFIGKVAEAFLEHDSIPESGVWKVMGDEVIFVALPRDAAEAGGLVAAFVRCVAEYDQRLAARWPLHIRGSCWAAELGRRNRMIEIPEMFGGTDGRPYRDFLGPDVDTGFRLSAHAGTGEVILSPNLAETLAQQPDSALRFHHIGAKSLKGVIGGMAFPLVLVSVADEGEVASTRTVTPSLGLSSMLKALRAQLHQQCGIEMAPPVLLENAAQAVSE